jgi:hypothetical protein
MLWINIDNSSFVHVVKFMGICTTKPTATNNSKRLFGSDF